MVLLLDQKFIFLLHFDHWPFITTIRFFLKITPLSDFVQNERYSDNFMMKFKYLSVESGFQIAASYDLINPDSKKKAQFVYPAKV